MAPRRAPARPPLRESDALCSGWSLPRHDLETRRLLSQDCVTNQTIQILGSRSVRGHVFFTSPGRSEGSPGLNSRWRHIQSFLWPLPSLCSYNHFISQLLFRTCLFWIWLHIVWMPPILRLRSLFTFNPTRKVWPPCPKCFLSIN